GKEFSTTGTVAKFCTPTCRAAYRRKDPSQVQTQACKRCGTPFLVYRTGMLYCSSECAYADRPGKQPKQCAHCGKEFIATDPRTVCCSRECGIRYKQQNRGEVQKERDCLFCNKTFPLKFPSSKKVFCSKSCSNLYRYREQ